MLQKQNKLQNKTVLKYLFLFPQAKIFYYTKDKILFVCLVSVPPRLTERRDRLDNRKYLINVNMLQTTEAKLNIIIIISLAET